MTILIYEKDGVNHVVGSGQELMKSLGLDRVRPMMLVDETGALLGAGRSLADVERSVPMIKALRDAESAPLRKSETVTLYRRAKPATDHGFGKMLSDLEELAALRKAHSGDDDVDDEKQTLASLVETQRKQIASLERALAKMQSRIG